MTINNQPDSDQKIKRLTGLLQSAYQKSVTSGRISTTFTFITLVILSLSLVVGLESALYLPAAYKVVSLSAALIVCILGTYLATRQIGFTDKDQFIERYLKTRTDDGENIQSALDLYHNRDQRSSVFYMAAIDSNLQHIDTKQIQDDLKVYLGKHRSYKFAVRSTLMMLLAVIIFSLTFFTTPDGFSRTISFWESYERPNPFQYEVTPGSITIEQGQTIAPSIEFTGNNQPETVTFSYKTDVEENFRQRPMRITEGTTFQSRDIEANSSISYHIIMDNFRSETYRLDVQIQPRFDTLIATVIPPEYTHLPNRELEYPYSPIGFYPGSVIRFDGKINKPVEELNLLSAQDTVTFHSEGNDTLNQFSAEINPVMTDTVFFRMTDQNGLTNRNPFRTFLRVTEDEQPVVVIREPTGMITENEPRNIEILYQVTDDFGVERAELNWEVHRSFVNQPEQNSRQLNTPGNGQNTRFNWDISDIDLRPRDEVRFHIRAMDNDAVSGGKWGQSQQVIIRVPSMAEFFDEIDSKERSVQNELDQVSDQFDQMEQEYEQFMERLKENPEGGFEEQEMLENVSEKQQQINETVEKLRQQFEELRQDMDESSSISYETRELYRELQQLMDELDDPDLQNALRELREAMENMNPNQIEQALENVSFNEELYKERLERTKELFKQLKMNSDLDKLARQYEDLSERTAESPESTLEQLKQEMETVKEDMNNLSEQLDRLDSNPPKRSEEQLRKLKEQSKEQLQQIREQMEQLGDDIDGSMEEGVQSPGEEMQQQQQQISQQLQQEAQNMRQMQQEMGGQQMQVNLLALQRALYTLLELSETQEFLSKDTQETANRSAGFVMLARQQNYVRNQFSSVADTIFQISSELPGVPNRINRKKAEIERTLQRAVDQMSERNQRSSAITSRESLGGINDLSSTIASLIDQLMDQDGGGEGGGGMSMQQMIEQLQQMSGDQQQLNQQLQNMVNDMQGDRLSREQSERLDEMARQQNEIRRQLRELQHSGALREGDQALSELQRMIDEMEDSINDMRGGVTDRLMIERQQNILSRMLSAEEAMERRGEEEEREGRRTDQFDSDLPPDMTLEELQQEIRSRLQDPDFTRFSAEHQRLIERYFEMLRRMEDAVIQ